MYIEETQDNGIDNMPFFLIRRQKGLNNDIDGILGMSRYHNNENYYFMQRLAASVRYALFTLSRKSLATSLLSCCKTIPSNHSCKSALMTPHT